MPRPYDPTEYIPDEFPAQVATHQMEILRDDGLYRHLRFRRPGTICMGFDIITIPGKLIYTGDMGTYVFSRLPDMLTFFRRPADRDRFACISYGYWAEKLIATDKADGARVYCPELLLSQARAKLEEFIGERGLEAHAAVALRDRFDWEVENKIADYEVRAGDAMASFAHEGRAVFPDWWEGIEYRVFSHRFVWCCHALRWAIDVYDRDREDNPFSDLPLPAYRRSA